MIVLLTKGKLLGVLIQAAVDKEQGCFVSMTFLKGDPSTSTAQTFGTLRSLLQSLGVSNFDTLGSDKLAYTTCSWLRLMKPREGPL